MFQQGRQDDVPQYKMNAEFAIVVRLWLGSSVLSSGRPKIASHFNLDEFGYVPIRHKVKRHGERFLLSPSIYDTGCQASLWPVNCKQIIQRVFQESPQSCVSEKKLRLAIRHTSSTGSRPVPRLGWRGCRKASFSTLFSANTGLANRISDATASFRSDQQGKRWRSAFPGK